MLRVAGRSDLSRPTKPAGASLFAQRRAQITVPAKYMAPQSSIFRRSGAQSLADHFDGIIHLLCPVAANPDERQNKLR